MRIVMASVATLLVVGGAAGCTAPEPEPFDLIIRGGRIIDGTRAPAYQADVGIRESLIAEIGDLSGRTAARIIDAEGATVTPGFIDMMGGSSLPLLLDPITAESKLRQGITTMMAGEGGSLAPQDDRTMEELTRATARGLRWRTFAEYFDQLEANGVALNVVHNVGAAQVRRIVLGDEQIDPTPEQLEEMKQLVDQAMRDGAVGLSTALIYPPGTYASTEEIIELAKVAAQYGGIYVSHMRNESSGVLEAIDEVIRIGTEAGLKAHIYHLKAAGQENWPLMEQALARIRSAREQGTELTADVYPYIRNGIGLGSFLHPRHYAKGEEAFRATLGDPAIRRTLREEVEGTSDWENWYRHVGHDWDNVLISRVGPDTDPAFVGLSVQGVAVRRGVEAWEAFFDLVEAGGVGVNPKSMDENQKHLAMRADFVCFDNDAAPTNPNAVASSHPRAFGAFPRILAKYVREEQVISLEEAIYGLAALPADILGLDRRGTIEPDQIADLVVFDPETVADTATFTDPLSYAVGFDHVIVRGQLVIDDERVTGARPGEVIRFNPQLRAVPQ